MGMDESSPKTMGVMRQSQTCPIGLGIEKLGKSRSTILRVAADVVAGQAGSHIFGSRDAAKLQLFNHETSDDLLVAGELVLGLLLQQLRLPNQERVR
jgi:hypothetical protein